MSIKKTEIEELYIGSYQRLLAKARQMLKDDNDASDAVSDVFARIAEGSMKLPEGHEESYLMTAIRTFENTELQQILDELADHYHLEVDYRNEQSRHIRLYTKWNTSAPLSQMVERLNSFEKVSIRQTQNQIIAE